MAMYSYPNNAHNNRAISLAEHEQILAPFARTGFIGYSATLPVFGSGATRTLMLRAGTRGTIRGTRFHITSDHTIGPDMIVANTSGQPRRDLLVMRLNRELADPNKFTINPVVITGAPAASPVAPSPVRNDTIDGTGVWDLPVLDFPVANGATVLPFNAADFRGWWTSPSGYTGLDYAKPPVEPGLIFRANDTGISYIGTNTGKWQNIYRNSGWINVSAPTGWTASPFAFARVNDLIVMTMRLIRTGAAIPATTSPTLYKVAENFAPSQASYGVYHCSNPDHSSHMAIGADGSVVLGGTGNTELPIGQNATVFSNMVWLAAS